MNQFDKKQTNILKPLLTHDVILHFSFYANTFPIAYHYNLLIEEYNNKNTENPKNKLIIPHSWNDTFPSSSEILYNTSNNKSDWKLPESINLFYSSNINFQTEELKKDNPYKKIKETPAIKGKKEKIKPCRFSKYAPRFVFLNNNLYTQKLVQYALSLANKTTNSKKQIATTIDDIEFKDFENIKNQYPSLSEIIKAIKALEESNKKNGKENVEIEKLCIYTETLNEAKDIFENYKSDWGNSREIIHYDNREINTLKLDDSLKNESKTLDIYYYGAPTSFLFLKRENRFLPVLLDKANISIETKAIIHYNSKKKENIIKKIKNAIEEYHKELYNTANLPKGNELLNNVRLAYNKYARLTRDDSYFFTPESFANCIALHHEYPKATKKKENSRKEVAIPKSSKKNIHVHYGAGKLGIGLVLPLIKPNNEANNELHIITKYRDEWSKKINTDIKEITLLNNADTSNKWEFILELKKLSADNSDVSNKDCFYLFDELEHTSNILEKATSISYSLKYQDIEKEFLEFLKTLKLNKDVLIFPFENKPFGINKESNEKEKAEAKELKGIRKKLKGYTKLKADRICGDRTFDLGNKVNVVCEEHIEVVLNIDEGKTNNLFDVTKDRKSQIIFTDNNKRYQFISDRKEYLVNELHFVLAVYGYDFLLSKGITHWENQFVTIIQSALTSDPKYKIPIETFIRLQIVRLTLLHRDIIKNEYDLQEKNVDELIYERLIKYAKGVTERFNASKEDQIKRVFNTDDVSAIERKYKTIVQGIEKFIADKKSDIKDVQILSAGTYLEYRELIQDIKNKIENIFHSRVSNFQDQIKLQSKEQAVKQKELENFDSKIKALTKKNENILIAFDVDGTLFKAKEIFLPAIKTVLSENNIERTDTYCMKFVGMPYNEFEAWQQQQKLKISYKNFKSRLQQLELKNIKEYGSEFKDVIKTLTTLKNKGYTLAICTNARKEYLEAVMTKCDLWNFFKEENILYPEKFPDRFSPEFDKGTMLNDLKNRLKPFKSFMVGDRNYDSKAAKKSGFEFIGVRYGYGKNEIKDETNLVDKIRDIEIKISNE